MPLQATSGAASYDAFGGGAAAVPNYIEDVFSTYLYTGNGSTQTITNGIDLAGEGGLVWTKSRSNATSNIVFDTAMGGSSILITNSTSAKITTSAPPYLTFNSNGFSFNKSAGGINQSPDTYASWTFRKQPKFFDVVTYTGNGVARTIAHDLGSVPGCIIVKRTDATRNWCVYHRSLGNTNQIILNSTAALESTALWNNTTPTSTVFSVNNDLDVNASGGTYVAYLFAHDAGGFGLTGTDNVISCGSFTTDGSTLDVNLGYEPQMVIFKLASSADDWFIVDNMRGWTVTGNTSFLNPNTSGAESSGTYFARPTATGFRTTPLASGNTLIYIAIRRGPMKVPTTGTSVLGLSVRIGTGSNATVTGSAGVTDLAIIKNRGATTNWVWTPRLTGTGYMSSAATDAEIAAGTTILQANPWDVMDGVKVGTFSNLTNESGNTFINYLIDRAPGFMDVVCYTGNDVARNLNHNLGVVPELWIVKIRSTSGYSWAVGGGVLGSATDNFIVLNSTSVSSTLANFWATPTATTFGFGSGAPSDTSINQSGQTYVAYLFASCPGVSKVGSYTGTGTTQAIDCGFTGGARFVLIKGATRAGGWYVWDTARGIVSSTEPHLRLNVGNAETTTDDWIDPTSSGFEISSTAGNVINESGFTFIFLAIA
jgi:hypothetical protein